MVITFVIYSPTEVLSIKQPQIVQELTSVLREWGVLWKRLYVVSDRLHFLFFMNNEYHKGVFFNYYNFCRGSEISQGILKDIGRF